MINKDIVTAVLLIIEVGILIFSKNLTLNIVVGIIMVASILFRQTRNEKKQTEILNELKNKNQTFMIYKESTKSAIALSIMMIMNCILQINMKVINKNIELSQNDKEQISGILEFIKTGTSEEISSIILWCVFIVIFTIQLIQCFNKSVFVGDKDIVFSDQITIDLKQIEYVNYVHQYFPANKIRILKIKTKNLTKKIVVDINDDNLKTYLENSV